MAMMTMTITITIIIILIIIIIIIIINYKKKPSNIGIKVPDIEWQTTGQNVRLLASNENPGYSGHHFVGGWGGENDRGDVA